MHGTQVGRTRGIRRECIASVIGLVVWLALASAQETGSATGAGGTGSPSMQSTAELDGWGEYSVGPGDVLVISVWKEPDVTSTVVVRTDGKISLPLVRDLYVDGMTPVAITKLVVEKLTPLINDPIVTVTVKEIHSKVIYVIGEVGRPGPYPVTRPMTVLQILTQAGGLSEFAKKKSVYVLRENNGRQEKLPFNYADVVNGKNMQQNILLKPGDTVVVP